MRPSGPSTTSSSRFPDPFQNGRHTEVPVSSTHSFEPLSGAFSFRMRLPPATGEVEVVLTVSRRGLGSLSRQSDGEGEEAAQGTNRGDNHGAAGSHRPGLVSRPEPGRSGRPESRGPPPPTAGERARGGGRDGRAWNRRGSEQSAQCASVLAGRGRLGNELSATCERSESRPASCQHGAGTSVRPRPLWQGVGGIPGPSLKLEREAVRSEAPRISSTVYPSARSASTARRQRPLPDEQDIGVQRAHREHQRLPRGRVARSAREAPRPPESQSGPPTSSARQPRAARTSAGTRSSATDDAQLALEAPGDGHEPGPSAHAGGAPPSPEAAPPPRRPGEDSQQKHVSGRYRHAQRRQPRHHVEAHQRHQEVRGGSPPHPV